MQHKGWNLIHPWIWLAHCHLGPFLVSTGFEKTSACHRLVYTRVIMACQNKENLSVRWFIILDTHGVFANKNMNHRCEFITVFEKPARFGFALFHFLPFSLLSFAAMTFETRTGTDRLTSYNEEIIKLTTCSTVKCRDNKLKENKKEENNFFSLWSFPVSYSGLYITMRKDPSIKMSQSILYPL